MTLNFSIKPPPVGKTFRLNNQMYLVMHVYPRSGYKLGQWLLEVRNLKEMKRK